ncbi:hypothetical protein V8C86DRAFT_1699177 [Haematococcus lacustris]
MVEEMSQNGHASANCSTSDPPRGLVLIGAGFARTGTMSTKAALEELLQQPVYHMIEAMKNKQLEVWADALQPDGWSGASRDAALASLAPYCATVDFPTHLRYKELLAEFPEAKVLLTVRDSFDAWYTSARNTVYQAMTDIQSSRPKGMVGLVEAYWGQRGLFQGKFEDKEEARKLHDAFLEEVQRVVPADRLLVFNVKQGWAPLCAFLGVPVPDDKPFPRLNDTAEFHNNVKKMTATAEEPLEASH